MKRIIRHLIMETLILLARITQRVRPPRIPIFVYHSIDPSPSPISLSPCIFERHLAYIQKHNYRLLSAKEAVEAFCNKNLVHKCAVITFDDAYTTIVPWIQNLLDSGQTATIFVPGGLMGKSNLWDSARSDIAQLDIMPIEQLQMLFTKGCDIGAHTQTHPNLTDISPDQCHCELRSVRTTLTKHLGVQIQTLAYPYGAYNEAVKKAAHQVGYSACFTTQIGYLTLQSDLFEIPRFPTNIDFQLFRLVLHGGYGWYRTLQDRLFGA